MIQILPMKLSQIILIITILSAPCYGLETRIEWTLGSFLPVSKVLDSGNIQELFCSVDSFNHSTPIILLCPLNVGICLSGCVSTKEISCSNLSNHTKLIYRFEFKVFKNFEGPWRCQYGSKSSRFLQLTVTDKPYIKSLSMIPSPVWKGSSLNITCQVMPMAKNISILFERLLEDNTSLSMPDVATFKIDKWTGGIIINSATPGQDDRIKCTIFTSHGSVTSKILKTNIYYFPKNLSLTSSALPEKRHEVGSLLSFQCSSDTGNPRPVLNIFHKRIGEVPKKMLDNSIILSKQDNKALFYCENEKVGGRKSFLKSNEITVIVNYPPEKIELTEEPENQLMESQSKQLVCLSKGNSEPQSKIEWSMTDDLGRNIYKNETDRILEAEDVDIRQANSILKSAVRMIMLRMYNGYSVTCHIRYQGRRLLSQTKIINVSFAPNHISLNSNPSVPIPEGKTVILECSTDSANPASKILWYKTELGKRTQDVTSHSNIDMKPGNFSGVAISSILSIHGPTRQDHGTLYKCVVSHAYMNTEISKEYFLNVLFSPVIRMFSIPNQVEEGDRVNIKCQTSGGNPSNVLLYNYRWKFCPVNISYQLPLNQEIFNKPSSDVRQNCIPLTDNIQPSSNFNITAITGKDRGWYSCNIDSPGGSTSEYLFLNVFYPPVLSYDTSSRVYAKPGSNIFFNAELSSNPTNVDINWYFRRSSRSFSKSFDQENHNSNIQLIPFSKEKITMQSYGRIKYSLLENNTIHLSISSITTSDYGEYFCEVKNRLGRKSLEFQLYDISILESNIRLQINGRTVTVYFEPPSAGHFSHLVLRICRFKKINQCKDMQIFNPESGKETITLPESPDLFSYRLLVFNGSTLLQKTRFIQKDVASTHMIDISMEMMVAIIIGVVGILVLLFVTLLTLILLKCRWKKPKDNYLENTSVATTNSHQRRHDYMLLNHPQNSSLLKNSCHCFPNYPMEVRSDNGSDHSVPSQKIYQSMVVRRKPRDNGEMNSIHSGGSCHSPDVVLTERTSINSSNNPMINGVPYPYFHGNGQNKSTILNERLHSLDGQRQEGNMPEEFLMPQELVFAAADDPSHTRIISIPKNLQTDYSNIYFQTNNPMTLKPYDINQPPPYIFPLPHCQNRLECNNQDSRENSSSTNTDSNQDSGLQDQSNTDGANNAVEKK